MRLLKTFISIHKNISVRATKYFFLLILMIVSLFIQAYMHNYNIVYIMMFFLTAIAGTSTLFGMLNLHPLEVKYISKSQFFAKKEGLLTFFANNSSGYALYDLDFYFQNSELKIVRLDPHEKKLISFNTTFLRRGEHTVEPIKVQSLFPMIHERKFRFYKYEEKIVVYPKPEGISLYEQFKEKIDMSGDIDDFKGISHFEQGENISSIHWASLAKNNTLMGKRYVYKREQERLEFRFDDIKGDIEQRLSQLTLWIVEADKAGLDFQVDLGGKVFDSTKGEIDEILSKLAVY